MENSDNPLSSGPLAERNCVSFVVIWERVDFHRRLGGKRGEGGARLRKVLHNISKLVKIIPSTSDSEVKLESQSTLDGNQARKDFVFRTQNQAKDFKRKVIESVKLPEKVSMKTFQFSEVEFGLELKPVLTEQDVLHLIKINEVHKHVFSHFLTCKVITEDHKILFRFNSISDVNLFLYNKCYDPRKRTLGLLRENQEQLRVLPDNDGRFSLVSSDGFLPSFPREKKPEWKDLEKKFKFRSKKLDGLRHLQFENTTDLFIFFVSENAKNCVSLGFPEGTIVEEFNCVELSLDKAKEDEHDVRVRLTAIEKELIAAKVNLAKKETIFENQNKIIKELRKELKLKRAT